MAEEYRLSLFGNSLMSLFSEIMIFDSEAIWKIYGMNIWRRAITTVDQVRILSAVCDAA
jgi:hypothetical protein